jgi:3-oxoacyl-(acyl-carrier-protein) synthase
LEGKLSRRVVVTGIGVVSPNGLGREAFWQACCQGRSGVRRIQRFDPSWLPVQIAGEVVGFEPTRYISEKDTANVSRVVPLAIAATHEAVLDAGLTSSQPAAPHPPTRLVTPPRTSGVEWRMWWCAAVPTLLSLP